MILYKFSKKVICGISYDVKRIHFMKSIIVNLSISMLIYRVKSPKEFHYLRTFCFGRGT